MRVVALTLLLIGLVGAPASAQSLEESQKAVLVFDIRMDMLNTSKLGKQMKFSEKMTEANARAAQMSGQEVGPDAEKLERIFGAMSAPKNMEAAMAMQGGGPLTFEFFARAKYKDAESAKLALQTALDGNQEEFEKEGRTLYKLAPGEGVPEGLIAHMVDDVTIEVGTEAYIYHEDRNVFTDNLKASWAKAPNEAIRLAMDLAGAQELVSELVEQGKANAPDPTVEPFLELIDNIKDLGISIDLSQKNLFTLRANAIDTENAEELKGGLDSLLFLAKTGGKQGLMMLKGQGPNGEGDEIAGVLGKILDSLKARMKGTDVTITIPRPKGFESAVEKATQLVPMMMMGGMGGPPGMGPGGPPPGQGGGGLAPPPLQPPPGRDR